MSTETPPPASGPVKPTPATAPGATAVLEIDAAAPTLDAAAAPTLIGSQPRSSPDDPHPVTDSARYTFEAVFAAGGLGRIRRAYDHRLQRHVAVKEIHAFRSGSTSEARFQREALLTARLEHPAIVPIQDLGRHPSGEPYYCMKLVDGTSLDAIVRARPTLADRLALLSHVLAVADALAYAHSRDVIHRDLKPANVLVGAFGETVVIDWGLAKELAVDDSGPDEHVGTLPAPTAAGDLTQAGEFVGTLPFMPLEQASGQHIDARADVYAIGAILYFVLSGQMPYEPQPAFAMLNTLLVRPPVDLGERVKGLPEDLLAIVRKAMARARADRYPDAQALAADLRRFQTGRLVSARPYSPLDVVRHYIRRYRALVGVAAVGLCLLAIVGAYSYWRVLEQKQEADDQRDAAVAAQSSEASARRVAETQTRLAELSSVELLLQDTRRALFDEHRPRRALLALRQAQAIDPNHEELRYLLAESLARADNLLYTLSNVDELRFNTAGTRLLTWDPAGIGLITRGPTVTLVLWDADTGAPLAERTLAGPILDAAFLPGADERYLVVTPDAVQLIDGTNETWRSETFAEVAALAFPPAAPARALLFAGDVNRVLDLRTGSIARAPGPGLAGTPLSSPDAPALLLDVRPKEAHMLERTPTDVLRVGADGQRLGSSGRALRNASHSLAVSADGRYISFVEEVGKNGVMLHDFTRDRTRKLAPCGSVDDQRDYFGPLPTAAFIADGATLLRLVRASVVARWDTATGACLAIHSLPGDEYQHLLPTPDGASVLVVGAAGSIRILNTDTLAPRHLLHVGDRPIRHVAIDPDAQHVAVIQTEGDASMWRLDDERRITSIPIHGLDRGARQDEAVLLAARDDGTRTLSVLSFGHNGDPTLVPFAEPTDAAHIRMPAGQDEILLAVTRGRKALELWSVSGRNRLDLFPLDNAGLDLARLRGTPAALLHRTPNLLDELARLGIDVLLPSAPSRTDRPILADRIATNPHARAVVIELDRGHLSTELHDLDSGASLARLSGSYANFSPDGRLLFTGDPLGAVYLYDAETGAQLRELLPPDVGHRTVVSDNTAHYSPDTQRFAVSTSDGTIELWDAESLVRIGRLSGHTQFINNMVYGVNSTLLASFGEIANSDGQAFLWDLDALAGGRLDVTDVTSAAFSPDDGILATGGRDGVVRLWSTRTRQRIGEFRGHDGPVVRLFFSGDGRRLLSGAFDDRVNVWALAQTERTPADIDRAIRELDGYAATALLADE